MVAHPVDCSHEAQAVGGVARSWPVLDLVPLLRVNLDAVVGDD